MQRVGIDSLAAWGQQLIARLDWAMGDSKRVTWTPNPRLIRYYTTLGLLDRPAAFQGRTALYGPRHLLQVLAIKRLQLDGKTLEDIQPLLYGRGDEALAALLGLTLPLPEPAPTRPAAFWEEVPTPRDPGRTLVAFEPLPGVQLLIDPARLPAGLTPEACFHALAQLQESEDR